MLASYLPVLFYQNVTDCPQTHGYLQVDTHRCQQFKAWLDQCNDKPKVGISWRTRFMKGLNRRGDYTDLIQWAPLLKTDRVQWVSLQYDHNEAELQAVEQALGIEILRPNLDLTNDLDGLAALIQALDLVIAGTNSVTAIAGAVGQQTWMTHKVPIHMNLGTKDMPFLPAVKGFACRDYGGLDDWQSLFKHLATHLQQHFEYEG
jgi:hypothetical protein